MPQQALQIMTGASFYVQSALILFFMVFISVLIREFLRPRGEVKHMADLPLCDENSVPPSQESVK